MYNNSAELTPALQSYSNWFRLDGGQVEMRGIAVLFLAYLRQGQCGDMEVFQPVLNVSQEAATCGARGRVRFQYHNYV